MESDDRFSIQLHKRNELPTAKSDVGGNLIKPERLQSFQYFQINVLPVT
jgi:hypothetical protein